MDEYYAGESPGRFGILFSFLGVAGTPGNPISAIAYPGRYVNIIATDPNPDVEPSALASYNNLAKYWNFSKFDMFTDGSGLLALNEGGRDVANAITQYSRDANGYGGAMVGGNDGPRYFFGNYVHDFGGPATTKFHHTCYFGSNRSGLLVPAPEIAWNFLDNNWAPYGLHTYNEGNCGDWSTTYKVHHDVVKDQVGNCFGLASDGSSTAPGQDHCWSMEAQFYNNVCINTGLAGGAVASTRSPFSVSGSSNHSTIKLYNNVFHGGGDPAYCAQPAPGCMFTVMGPGISSGYPFGGTWELVNNIVVDTLGTGWEMGGASNPTWFHPPDVEGNNLWYSTSSARAKPYWASAPTSVYADPLFTAPSLYDLTLQSNSPGIDNGASTVASVVSTDFAGAPRPLGAGFDIGAYEYDAVAAATRPAPPTGLTVQ